ncbi:phytanoyl-CoA dioxygenase family protein [Steroidobacter cummioxidans]|uniref:phytanoyl-CoA dioxygenase family protein n=1 Tax=Steroidobacter cummioxidans TaxID=1803913 RepID=UPI00137A591F|nr:phytanoyl-CoA dioxygenase family protein [Steroidobacter cummioxidans]
MELRPWFEEDDYRSKACYRDLSSAQQGWVDQFRNDGYLVLEETGIPPATLTDAVAQLVGKYTQPATGYDAAGRVQDAWQHSPAVRQIATEPAILAALQALYQRPPVPFQTLNFERGTEQRSHSDTIHFNTLPFGFMCGVWVALEDIDLNNGPLRYFPGSQRLPVFHMDDLGLEPVASEYQKYEDRIEKILADAGFSSQPALLKRGQCLIWSANIFHGGSPVLDRNRTRLSQVTHYYFPGCIYYTPLLSSPQRQLWRLRQVQDLRTLEAVPTYEGLPRRRKPKEERGFLSKVFGG